MNTGDKNVYGRTIWRGPRGGEYTINPLTGQKVRTFRRAAAPAPAPASPGVPGFIKTPYVRLPDSLPIYKKVASGRYYIRYLGDGGLSTISLDYSQIRNTRNGIVRSLRNHVRHAAAAPVAPVVPAVASPPPSKKVAKLLKLNRKYVSRTAVFYNKKGKMIPVSPMEYNRNTRLVFGQDPKYLYKTYIPYIHTENNATFLPKLKVKRSNIVAEASRNRSEKARVYYNTRYGDLYYVTLNGRKIKASVANRLLIPRGSHANRVYKRLIGAAHPNYPREAIPPNTPPARAADIRGSPALLENMLNQIYNGGRGRNINASRYTDAERNVLVRRLSGSILFFKQQRNMKRAEATESRSTLRNMAGALTNAEKNRLRASAVAANERVGYYDDAVRAYTRGLRAVKPLTGAVSPRARAMPATPNRATPAPAAENMNAIYMPLERPHLVVKTPGAGTIYLNPNTFTGFMRNASRVNIPVENVRNWLRTARRNFPNEGLFRHPVNRSKNVTARHIRFSRS